MAWMKKKKFLFPFFGAKAASLETFVDTALKEETAMVVFRATGIRYSPPLSLPFLFLTCNSVVIALRSGALQLIVPRWFGVIAAASATHWNRCTTDLCAVSGRVEGNVFVWSCSRKTFCDYTLGGLPPLQLVLYLTCVWLPTKNKGRRAANALRDEHNNEGGIEYTTLAGLVMACSWNASSNHQRNRKRISKFPASNQQSL